MLNLCLVTIIAALCLALATANFTGQYAISPIRSALEEMDYEEVASAQQKVGMSKVFVGGIHEREGHVNLNAADSFDPSVFLASGKEKIEAIVKQFGQIEDSRLIVAFDRAIGVECRWSTDMNEGFIQWLHVSTEPLDSGARAGEDFAFGFRIAIFEYRK